jgi:hypothetical protein
MLKITQNWWSKIEDISCATAYVNLFIAIARKTKNSTTDLGVIVKMNKRKNSIKKETLLLNFIS